MGAAFAAGIGSGFWSKEWVLHGDEHTSQDFQDFQPKVLGQLMLSRSILLGCSTPQSILHSSVCACAPMKWFWENCIHWF
jgi:hypothetical protein